MSDRDSKELENNLVGKNYVFPDGAELRVVQCKRRDDGFWITYETVYPHCIPKRNLLIIDEFIGKYGHLFQN